MGSRDGEDRERSHRHRHRERERDRGFDDEKEKEKDKGREKDRHREHRHSSRDDPERSVHSGRSDRDRDRDRHKDQDRHRSHRRTRSPSRSRTRSPDASRDKKSKQTAFDQAPTSTTPPMMMPVAMPGVLTNPINPSGKITTPYGMGHPGMPNMPNMAAMPFGMFPFLQNSQATRHARRVYVGGLPPLANEQMIATFFSHCMHAIGGNTAAIPGDAVVNVYVNHEKKFAFVEMRTVEEASNAMALDGVIYEGVPLRIRRPSDYNPGMAATLGPSQPNPSLNLSAVGLTPGSTGSADGPDRIFIGGLPYYLTEDQIKELLSSFGPLRGFNIVKDHETGNSKGYGFCVYQDPSITDIACAALNNMKMGDKVLTVRRATASGQPKPDQADVLAQAQQQIAIQKMALAAAATGANMTPLNLAAAGLNIPGVLAAAAGAAGATETPTRVLCLANVVSKEELIKDEDYNDIMEDMREECGKHGTLANLVIPRPQDDNDNVPGLGKVFVEYTDTDGAQKAKAALHGRKFGGNPVTALFYPEEKFARADYGGL